MEETLQAVIKNIDQSYAGEYSKFVTDFRKTYPPQPQPQQYGYDPKQNPINTNSEPTESVLAQTSAALKGPAARSPSRSPGQQPEQHNNDTAQNPSRDV
jgi:hypothetical protein